jgi:hypothetical protein
MTPGLETPVLQSKKITIHVGGSRGSTTASPAPQTGQSSDSGRPDGATNGNRNVPIPLANTSVASFQLDNTRPGPVTTPRPVVGPMPGVGVQHSPAAFPRPNSNAPGVMNVPNGMQGPPQMFQQPYPAHQLQNGHPHPHPAPAPAPAPAPPLYDNKYRAPGRGKPMIKALGHLVASQHVHHTNVSVRRC